MSRWDKRMDLTKKLQEELDRRTKVEEEAIQLISECKFEEANILLRSIDDSIVRQIAKELDDLDTEKEENAPTTTIGTLFQKERMKYTKILADGSKCEFIFSINVERTDGNISEILENFAKLSKSAYINLGNKMRYGTAEQEKIKQLAENDNGQQ